MDAAARKAYRQAGRAAIVTLVDKLARCDGNSPRRRPFQQFGPVEAGLIVEPIAVELAFVYPAVDLFGRSAKEGGDVCDGQVHRVLLGRLAKAVYILDCLLRR